jgi:hypothetical protein
LSAFLTCRVTAGGMTKRMTGLIQGRPTAAVALIGWQGEQLLWVTEPASGVWAPSTPAVDPDLQGCQAGCPLARSMSRAARKRNKCLERFAWCPLALFHDLSAPVGVPAGA